VDAGSNDIVNMVNLTTDITGAQRIQGERVDMGAYERPAPGLAQLPLVGAACAGSTGGHILLDPFNGCEPYTYTWYPAAGTGPELADVPAGEYHFTITDSRGRSFSDTLTVPSAPSVQLTPVVSDIICGSLSGGVAAAVVSGGTPPFQYSWSNGYADSLQTGMHPGSYTVAVSDASGCTDSESVSVSLSGQLTLYVNGGPIVCSGDHNGFLSAAALNGRPPFDYLWSPFGQTDSLIEQLGPGDYSVTVNDTYGCSSSFSYHLDDPSVLVPNIISQACSNPLFPNGTAYTYADGGVQPHKYLWSNGGTTQQITGLSAGVYEVTITDAHGCTVTDSVEIKLLSGTESESVAELRVWPNPASEYATVEGSALREGDQVSLYSLTGKALQRSEVSGGKAILKLPLLPAGVYRWQWEQAGTVRKSGLLEKL
ncbi:MAG: choice-of-anchor Q domain-containing protein, partial [Bacteroidota bacterium]